MGTVLVITDAVNNAIITVNVKLPDVLFLLPQPDCLSRACRLPRLKELALKESGQEYRSLAQIGRFG